MKLIVAISKNNVIGKDGKLPWKCPEDMLFFKQTTIDNVVVMGYNTYKSLGNPLKGRFNVVIDKTIETNNIIQVDSDWFYRVKSVSDIFYFETILRSNNREIFVIGGAKTYQEFLNLGVIDELIVTHINETYDGDTFFHIPEGWKETGEKVLSERATVRYYHNG